MHPKKDNYSVRCWGLELVPDFDIKKCPFAVARDNLGIVLIDISRRRAFWLTDLPISVNLFGHGNILKLLKSKTGEFGITTVIQNLQTETAILIKADLPRDFTKALQNITSN